MQNIFYYQSTSLCTENNFQYCVYEMENNIRDAFSMHLCCRLYITFEWKNDPIKFTFVILEKYIPHQSQKI